MTDNFLERRNHAKARAGFVVRPELRFYHQQNTSALPTLVLECNLFTQQEAWLKSPVNHPSQLIYLDEYYRFETKSFDIKLCPSQYSSQDMFYRILEENLINWDEYYEFINDYLIKRMVFRIHERIENELSKGNGANCQYLDMFVDMTLKLEHVLDGRIQGIPWRVDGGRRLHGGMVPASKISIMELPERMEINNDQCLKDLDCVICLQQLESEKILCMPCSHMFHGDCIKTWLDKSHYCPICRYDMLTTT